MVPADLDGGGVAGWSYSQECLQEKYRDIYSLPDRSSFRVGTRESRPIALGSSTSCLLPVAYGVQSCPVPLR